MKALASIAFAAACAFAAAPSGAASCSVTAVSLAFGSYNAFRISHTDSNGNIAVTCTGVPGEIVSYTMTLSAGGSGTPGLRQLRSASGSVMGYNLYTTTARTTVWGDGNAGTVIAGDSFALSGPRTTRNYPLYGRTFARQNVPVGLYSDSIVITLNF